MAAYPSDLELLVGVPKMATVLTRGFHVGFFVGRGWNGAKVGLKDVQSKDKVVSHFMFL